MTFSTGWKIQQKKFKIQLKNSERIQVTDMPTIIFWVAVSLICLSGLLQVISLTLVNVSFFTFNSDLWCVWISDLYDSAKQIRKTATTLFLFIFLISTKKFMISNSNSLFSISAVYKYYALFSCVLLLLCMFTMIVRVAKKIKSPNVITLVKNMKKSSMWSVVSGFFISYLLNI